ncbi:MAG: type II secretion system protein J [Vulcanimicrobiota bacterium]
MTSDRSRAFTQLELIMALGVFSIIMILCAQLFTTSWQRFHILNVVQDVKMSGIRGMERFADDFNETSTKYIMKKDNSGGNTLYVCFPSRRKADGSVVIDKNSTKTIWRTWFIYYLIPAASVSSGNLSATLEDGPGGKKEPLYYLVRKRRTIPDSQSGDPSLEAINDINPELGTMAPVRTDPSKGAATGAEVCARNVTYFKVDTEHGGGTDTYKAILVTYGTYNGKRCSSRVERSFLIQNI